MSVIGLIDLDDSENVIASASEEPVMDDITISNVDADGNIVAMR